MVDVFARAPRWLLASIMALLLGLLTLGAAPVAAEEGGGPTISAEELPVVSDSSVITTGSPELQVHSPGTQVAIAAALLERAPDLPHVRIVRDRRWSETTRIRLTRADFARAGPHYRVPQHPPQQAPN